MLRSRPTTPYPFGAKAALLAKLAYSRRQFSPFGQRLRAVHTHLPPANACALIGAVVRVVHRQTHFLMRLPCPQGNRACHLRFDQTMDAASHNPAPFEPTTAHASPSPSAKASHSPRLWRAIIQIVHRTSYIVHRQTPSAYVPFEPTTRHAPPSPSAPASQFREPEARQISKS